MQNVFGFTYSNVGENLINISSLRFLITPVPFNTSFSLWHAQSQLMFRMPLGPHVTYMSGERQHDHDKRES